MPGKRSAKIARLQALWSQKNLRTCRRTVRGRPCQGRSASVLVYREWTLVDRFPHIGQRAMRDKVLAVRVMAFASARTPMRFSSLGAGRTVRESDMGNLDDLPDLLSSQLAAPLHRKLGRTAFANRSELSDQVP